MKLLFKCFFILLFVSGCQTTGMKQLNNLSDSIQGQASDLTKSIASLNPLKADYYKLEKLINQEKYIEAKSLLTNEKSFF